MKRRLGVDSSNIAITLMPASILILTDNDECNLPDCLQSVRWSDDVHVMDSFSNDRTVEIAMGFGAQVTQRASEGPAAQLNAAINSIPFKYPWLLVLAPDERVTQGLEAELKVMYYYLGSKVAFEIRQREVVWGQPLKMSRADACPIRFFSWDSVRFHGSDPVVAEVSGPVGRLEAVVDRHPLAKGIDSWIAGTSRVPPRHGEGSGMVAATDEPPKTATSLMCRALLNFLNRIVVQQAFRDGHAGVAFAALKLLRECLSAIKRPEQREIATQKGPSQTPATGGLWIHS